EDGIRDKLVTGVQTCALPISNFVRAAAQAVQHRDRVAFVLWFSQNVIADCNESISREHDIFWMLSCRAQTFPHCVERGEFAQSRSEERRVGKECRSRWWGYY